MEKGCPKVEQPFFFIKRQEDQLIPYDETRITLPYALELLIWTIV